MRLSKLISFVALCLVPALPSGLVAAPQLLDSELRAVGLARYWEAKLPLDRHDSVKEAFLVDDALYVSTNGGILFAIKADAGLIRWAERLDGADFVIREPAHLLSASGWGAVVVTTSAGVSVLDRYDGDVIGSFTPEFELGSRAVGYNNVVFMGSTNGRMYSLRLEKVGDTITSLRRWVVSARGAVTASPVLYDFDKLLFATRQGAVYSCFAADKRLHWVFRTGGEIVADPAIGETGIYIASRDRSLYKVDGATGRMIWRHRFPCELEDKPMVVDQTVYQHCDGHGLFALDTDSGAIEWHTDRAKTIVARLEESDVLFAGDGRLLTVDRDSGDVQGETKVPGVFLAVPNVRDDFVFLLTRDGQILCARSKGTPRPTGAQVEAQKQRLRLPLRSPSHESDATALSESKDTAANADPFRSRRDSQP